MGGERVLRTTWGPENLTSTSAMADLELATSSLMLSLMEDEAEDVGDGSREAGTLGGGRGLQGYGLPGCGVLGLMARFSLGLRGGFLGLRGDMSLGLDTASLGLRTSVYTFLCFLASRDCKSCCNSLM